MKFKITFPTIVFISLGLFVSVKAHAAILYSQTANQDVYEQGSFTTDWYLDTEGKPINSISLQLNFSADTLQAVSATTGNSLVSLWIQSPKIDNDTGTINLVGGIPNGAKGSNVPIFRTTFVAKKSGTASIGMDPNSAVLLNDGQGTSEVLKFKDEVFNIYPQNFVPNKIISDTNPDQNVWYKSNHVEIHFDAKNNTDYSYSFSSNIEIVPDNTKMSVPDKIDYENLPDGIYYFKLNSKSGNGNWTEAGVFRVQIDATAPEKFTPIVASDPAIFDGNKFLSFSTVDKTSGISHYTVRVGTFGKTQNAQSPNKITKPLVGDTIWVTAYDLAGNSITAAVAYKGYLSVLEFEIALGILIFLLLVVICTVSKKSKPKLNQIERDNL